MMDKFYKWLIANGKLDRPISELMELYEEFQHPDVPVDSLKQYHKPRFKILADVDQLPDKN